MRRPGSAAPHRPADRTSRRPRATYRLQLGPDLSLDDAARLADHLGRLGISDLYVSPILTPTPGATHGYHVTDPTTVDPSIGGEAGLRRLQERLPAQGLGLVVDIVPNHLAAHPTNPWWRDVLTHGPSSAYATFFDVDWDTAGGRVVLPALDGELDTVIAGGELRVVEADEGAELAYRDTRFPLAPGTRAAASELVGAEPDRDALRALLDAQHYELRHWRSGVAELNYRRFFDITDLVGLRVERPEVFAARHARLLGLARAGSATGFRVDHVDGLRDPTGYLVELREAADEAGGDRGLYLVVEKILEGDEPLPPEWPVAGTTGYELLTAANAVLVDVEGLARLDRGYRAFVGGEVGSAGDTLHRSKLAVLEEILVPEVDGLTRRLADLATLVPDAAEVADHGLRRALVALTACFPVYRTYTRDLDTLRPDDRAHLEAAFTETRRRHPEVDGAALVLLERVLTLDTPAGLAAAVRRDWLEVVLRWQQLTGPAMAKGFEDTTFYVFTRLVSLNEVGVDVEGIEEPHDVAGFHARVARRAERWPAAMNATSTHDTKRSEDVRARLAVLSEIADEWVRIVRRWHELTATYRTRLGAGTACPSPNDEWALYQDLVGMWPLDEAEEATVPDRLVAHARKAAREAKAHTSWLDPDEAYEGGLERFVRGALDDAGFVSEVEEVVDRIALPGAVNSLAQVTWKLLAPGVPDVYQGTELWDWSLVDPDNRRPVDHGVRRRLLDAIVAAARDDRLVLARELRDTWWDGRLKLYLTWALLQLRGERPELHDGPYQPLRLDGEHAGRVVAFARGSADRWTAAVAPRLVARLPEPGRWPTRDVWGGTLLALPPGAERVREVLTGRELAVEDGAIRLAHVLSRLPVAALTAG